MNEPNKIGGLFADTLSYCFEIDAIAYDGKDLDLIILDGEKRFRLIFANISIFLDTNVFDIWMFWDRFKDDVERSIIFELPDSELRDYLLVAHPSPSATTQGARVFCVLSKERVFLMLFRVEPEFKISPII